MTTLIEQIQSTLLFEKKIQAKVADALKPLFRCLNITFFAHERVFNDNSKALLTSNAEVLEFWLRQQYPLDIVLGTGCYLGSELGDIYPIEQQQALSKHFNIGHTLFIVEEHHNYAEVFMLSTNARNSQIIHAYLTYIENIKLFLSYYKYQCAKLLTLAEKHKLFFINAPSSSKDNFKLIPANSLINSKKNCYFINKKIGYITLSRRELACITWLVKGRTAAEIGMVLNISKRTVEAYIENIKIKFDCSKLTELAYLIGRADLNVDFPTNI